MSPQQYRTILFSSHQGFSYSIFFPTILLQVVLVLSSFLNQLSLRILLVPICITGVLSKMCPIHLYLLIFILLSDFFYDFTTVYTFLFVSLILFKIIILCCYSKIFYSLDWMAISQFKRYAMRTGDILMFFSSKLYLSWAATWGS